MRYALRWRHHMCSDKKRRIELEIQTANEAYEKDLKENEKPLETMTLNELKEKYKTLTGKTTRVRKIEKLVELIRNEMKHREKNA
ncbi:MAG: hypothetical protein AB2693_25445 [Candidatus Thiodiazotropha sp.]